MKDYGRCNEKIKPVGSIPGYLKQSIKYGGIMYRSEFLN
jgi:hypothetical protein